MKTTYLGKLFCLLGGIILLAACSEEENDFEGRDNNITSFELIAGGVSYRAALTGSEILLTVPENVLLTGAVATVELSEGAEIAPDPSTVTAWDERQEFKVTSHNGSVRTYIYTVEYDKILSAGNVTLTTQEEVDAFAATGITCITGNLVIGKETGGLPGDTILDLSGLQKVEEITYNLIIHGTYGGEKLHGLASLQKVGAIRVMETATLKEFALPAVESIKLDLLVEKGPSVIIMEKLLTAGSIAIENDSLKALDFPRLTACSSFIVTSRQLETFSVPNMAAVDGDFSFAAGSRSTIESLSLPSLQRITGDLNISSSPMIVEAEWPDLTYVGGRVSVNLPEMEELLFGNLEEIGSLDITLESSAQYKKLSFPALRKANWVTITTRGGSYMSQVEEVSFPLLQEVSGTFTLSNVMVTELLFDALQSVGNLSVNNMPQVASFHFPALAAINGKLTLTNTNSFKNDALTDLDGFSSLRSVEEIEISYFTGLTSYQGLAGAINTVNSLRVTNCAYNPVLDDLRNGHFIN